jgi:hypothetical protein
MRVKITVSEKPSEVTPEIKNLINREADLMNRGRPAKFLEGLRERILLLYLKYVMDPEMNPEVRNHMTRVTPLRKKATQEQAQSS